ncbi:hypothetical protein V3391_08080 [Luteimonas sp. SMYT11W]|uniref:Uncharacterized protein n=1 Tax=Luteimonas flava TaxID=3115822 RepID=A0ABU7WDZ2_9GAMM
MSRPISHQEAKLVARVLAVGAKVPPGPALIASIPALSVTATCRCGCATIWFGPDGDATVGHLLAEAPASIDGASVAVIVWSQGDAIAGLEIIGYEASGLPGPLSVTGYGDP